MNKENNKSAAGMRRSAVAERIRLREEWSALKEIDSQPAGQLPPGGQRRNIVNKDRGPASKFLRPMPPKCGQTPSTNPPSSSVLRGCVSLVEVGNERAALPLRAALAALGASVLPAWSPLVTHLIWAHGGSRSVRARARALASHVVSPLWVEACASAARRLPERAFPAASRPSDLPSPKTLTRLLKKEMENIPIADLLSESPDKEQKMPRLRISSETEDADTSTDISRDQSIDTSRDKSTDTSKDKSSDISKDMTKDTSKNTTDNKTSDSSTDVNTRVNTAPRRALPKLSESISPRPQPTKSRRKLFTQKEGEMAGNLDEDEKTTSKPTQPLTQHDKRGLARAERMARRFFAQCRPHTQPQTLTQTDRQRPRIVLTGMSGEERRTATEAIRKLKGKIQTEVDHRTTHVLLGSCQKDDNGCTGTISSRPRTVKALAGGARGARVLPTRWATDSAAAGHWLHTQQYELPQFRKISQKARVERTALGKKRSEYVYDVFHGMRVFVTDTAEQRDGAIQLLKLCGAVVINGTGKQCQTSHNSRINNQTCGKTNQTCGKINQTCGKINQTYGKHNQISAKTTQNYLNCYLTQPNIIPSQNQAYNSEYDVRIGDKNGDISSKWVFDSVASARMRTTRRYVVNSLSNSEVASQILDGQL